MKRLLLVLMAAGVVLPAVAQLSPQASGGAPSNLGWNVAPSKAGMVTWAEGNVQVGQQALTEPLIAQFPYVKEGEQLRTAEGRAEVLMNPGNTVRVGENSSVRMITNRFIDTRVELEHGSAVAQWAEYLKDNGFTVVLKNATATVVKAGDYRFDAEPARIKVYAGAASVAVGGKTIELTAGRMLNLAGGVAAPEKFNIKETDALDRWAARRGELQSMANASAAKDVYDRYGSSDPCYTRGFVTGYISPTTPCVGTWRFNNWYGLWTYIPMNNRWCDPMWGYCYYSPSYIYNTYYRPVPVWANTGGGGMGMSPGYAVSAPTSGGYSGTMAASSAAMSAPSAGTGSSASAAAASSSVGRGSAASGGHGK